MHLINLAARWAARIFLLSGLILVGTALPALAQYEPVDDPAIEISQSRPFFDRHTGIYWLDIEIRHRGATDLSGPLRLVVKSTNKSAQGATGATASGEPWFRVDSGAQNKLAAGAALTQKIGFSGGRGQLVASLLLERDVPEQTNLPPTANPGADQEVRIALGEQSVSVTLDGTGSTDPEGSVARYVWSGDADPEDIPEPTLTLSPGRYELILVVYDDRDLPSTPARVAVTVLEALPPAAPIIEVEATSMRVDEGGTLRFNVSATDPDGDRVTLTATPSLSNGALAATPAVDPRGVYSFSPGENQAGAYMVELTARDRWGLVDRQVVEIQVDPVNAPPVLSVDPEHSVAEGALLAIPIQVSDPDGDIPTLSAVGLPPNAVLLPAQRLIQFAPDYDQAGVYDLVLHADDGTLDVQAPLRIRVADNDGGGHGTPGLSLAVDPVQSPTFLKRIRVTGNVNGTAQPTAAPAPFALITGLSPTQTSQGEALTVLLTGAADGRWQTHFASGSTRVDFGAGVTVSQVEVLGPEAVRATISIAPEAKTGLRQIRVTSGDETAVSVLGFAILAGTASFSGVLIDAETGDPIIGAVVTLEGGGRRTTSGADGSFELTGVPSGAHNLLVNAPNHSLIRTPITAVAGSNLSLGEIQASPTVLAAGAAGSASVLSLVARGIGDPTRPMSFEQARAIVRDALMLVGGSEIGILDPSGNQQNPVVGTDIPFFSFNEDSVATMAERMLTTERRTLAEVLNDYTKLWDWDGEPPMLLDWLSAIQTVVDNAWNNPGDRRNALLFLLFNPERTILASPPTIVADLPLNALQATLAEITLIRNASRTIDPEALHDAIVLDYPELAEAVVPGHAPAPQSFVERLLDSVIPTALASDPLSAAAERTAYEIHVREKLPLAARTDVNPGIAGLAYRWSLTSRPTDSTSAAFTRIDERIAYLKTDVVGDYKVRLTVTAPGKATAETEITVTSGNSCDGSFTAKLANADATWEEVACVFAGKVPESIAKGAITGQLWGWLKGAAPISSYNAKIAAANSIKGFSVTNGIGYPAARVKAMSGLEEALPGLMKRAQTQNKVVQFSKFGTKLMLSSTAGFIQGQAASLSRDIMYAVLDKVIDQVVESVRPAPPTDVRADPVTAEGTSGGAAVLVTFDRSPSQERYIETGATTYQAFYYKIYRERPGGILEQIFVGAPSKQGQLREFARESDGTIMMAFADTDPPEGQLAYYVTTRRIVGKGPVITQTWSESEFWIGQVLGVLSPPGMNQYNFAKAMSERGINLLKQVRLQDSDLSIPARIYLPRAIEGVKLPVALAATPEAGRFSGEVLMSVPEIDSVFSFAGGSPDLLLHSGFKVPYQAGIAVDAFGNVYMDNAASDERFGGRIWRWNQDLGRSLFGSVQYFSQLLMYSKPAAVQSMTAGWMFGGEHLYIADRYSGQVRDLPIPADGGSAPNPAHYVSQPITGVGEVPILADTTMAVNDAAQELLISNGDNLLRYRNIGVGVRDLVFPQHDSPFSRIGGVDADRAGTLYVGDAHQGEILAIPADKRTPAFYQSLLDDPWVRDLYTLMADLSQPGELRVAGHQKSLMWVDGKGIHHYPFGFSGRIVQADGSALVGARVSIGERMEELEVRTNEHGIFKLRGLRGPGLADELTLLVRAHSGEVGQFQVLLNSFGHTFSERMDFQPVRPPPPPDHQDPPPTPPVVPPQIVKPGETTVIETAVEMPETLSPAKGTASVIGILSPADGMETDQASIVLRGFVIGGTVLSAVLERNDAEAPLSVQDGTFETTVALGTGLNRLRVTVESLDGDGNPVVGQSEAVQVFKIDTPATGALTGALVGRVFDEATELPVPGASVFARDYGISALTDRNGVWQLNRVPPGQVYLELVP